MVALITPFNAIKTCIDQVNKWAPIIAGTGANNTNEAVHLSLTQVSEIIANAGDKIDVISGDDFLTFPIMACGGKGGISVTANIAPGPVKQLVVAAAEGDYDKCI